MPLINQLLEHPFDYTRTEPCIITETEEWAVVYKPPNLPSAPIRADETHTAVYWFLQHTNESARSIIGRKAIEAGLLHRLDTGTRGLILFAKTQTAYNFFITEQQQDRLIKTYYAFSDAASSNVLPCFPACGVTLPYSLRSQFRNYGPKGKKVAAVFPDSRHYNPHNRVYETIIEEISSYGAYCRLRCRLSRGHRHQVRVHLAGIGLPITGDPLYNMQRNDTYTLQLYATALSFSTPEMPLHRICVALPPPDNMNP